MCLKSYRERGDAIIFRVEGFKDADPGRSTAECKMHSEDRFIKKVRQKISEGQQQSNADKSAIGDTH